MLSKKLERILGQIDDFTPLATDKGDFEEYDYLIMLSKKLKWIFGHIDDFALLADVSGLT